jgi:hypothetical protein
MAILIFKGLTARRIYKSFGVKGLPYTKIYQVQRKHEIHCLFTRVFQWTDRQRDMPPGGRAGGRTDGRTGTRNSLLHKQLFQPLFASNVVSCAGGTYFKTRKEFQYHDISMVSLSSPRQEPE